MQSLGLHVIEIPTDAVTGIDLNYLEEAIKKSGIKACVFVPSFNNPLGCCMPDENKKALVELITKHRIPLIEDDIYGELYFGHHRPRCCKTYDKEGWVLYCSSISKSLAPGYRIGWTIPGRFKEQLNAAQDATYHCGRYHNPAYNGAFPEHWPLRLSFEKITYGIAHPTIAVCAGYTRSFSCRHKSIATARRFCFMA